MIEQFLVTPGSQVRLADHDPDFTGAYADKASTKAKRKAYVDRLQDLQEVLWAEGKHSLLIVL
ncbi:MAG: polyphosphate kinase 2 family protein, partial [Anaerolineae bacterium]